MNRYVHPLAMTAFLLVACSSQSGNRQAADQPGNATTTPPASSGADQGTAGNNDSVVYAGAQVSGDHFSTSDPIDRVVAWYWDPEHPVRQQGGQTWAVSKPEKRDDGYLVQFAIVGENMKSFVIYLNPNAAGGTDGRVRQLTDEELKSGVQL